MANNVGRPMMEGVVRYANQRINQAETQRLRSQIAKDDNGPPSPKILRERQMFNAKCFKGGNQAQHAGDVIGQLWLLGLLDVHGYDETRLLNAARLYWRGREEAYKSLGHKTAKFERASRTSGFNPKQNKLEKAYDRYGRFLLDAEEYDQDCFADLMAVDVDGNVSSWASRIIQTELLKFMRLPLALLATDDDYKKWAAAKRAIMAMAGAEALVRSDAA